MHGGVHLPIFGAHALLGGLLSLWGPGLGSIGPVTLISVPCAKVELVCLRVGVYVSCLSLPLHGSKLIDRQFLEMGRVFHRFRRKSRLHEQVRGGGGPTAGRSPPPHPTKRAPRTSTQNNFEILARQQLQDLNRHRRRPGLRARLPGAGVRHPARAGGRYRRRHQVRLGGRGERRQGCVSPEEKEESSLPENVSWLHG